MGKTNVEALLETLIKTIQAGAGGGATEATLQALLVTTQNDKDFETLLVKDNGAGGLVVRQTITLDETTLAVVITYSTVAGAPYVPVGPIVYLDNSTALASILAELQLKADLTETQPVITTSQSGALTDGSGSIAVLNVSQQIFAANAARKYLLVQNISAVDMYVNFGAAATVDSNSVKLLASGSIVFETNFIPTGNVTVICAVGGSKFVAKQG